MKVTQLSSVFLLTVVVFSLSSVSGQNLWPWPQSITNGTGTSSFTICDYNSVFESNLTSAISKKITFYQQKIFGHNLSETAQLLCKSTNSQNNQVPSFSLAVLNTDTALPKLEDADESYILTGTTEGKVSLKANTYLGFLRGLETLSQILRQTSDSNVQLSLLPFTITDKPHFAYRGIMIDTARNFLEKSSILRTLDAMMYNKLSVLHWHITDDESFPIELPSIPEMQEFGSFGRAYRYSVEDVKEIVQYAAENGVRVIPEVDSPGHVRSWGRSDKYKNITVACNGGEHYNSQIDPTIDLTYEANERIFKDIQDLFPDQFIHMGGDEAYASCWKLRPSIQTFMTAHNISSYDNLQKYYRKRQGKSVSSNRTKIYWANEALNIPPAPEDVIQFWGKMESYGVIASLPNKVILSPDNFLYINSGINFIWGNFFGNFTTWLNIYQVNLAPTEFDNSRVLGAENALWGEVNTDSTLDVYLWARSSALAERLWTGNHLSAATSSINMLDLGRRLSFMEDLLVERGISAAPVTNRFCKQNLEICFSQRTANVYQSPSQTKAQLLDSPIEEIAVSKE